jgi:hypothetical protein
VDSIAARQRSSRGIRLARTERTWTEFTDQCNPLRQVIQRRWTLVDARPVTGQPGMWAIAIGNTPLRATVPAADLRFI